MSFKEYYIAELKFLKVLMLLRQVPENSCLKTSCSECLS